MLGKFLIAICFLLIVSGTALAQKDVTVEFEGRYWITDLTAKAKVTDDDIGTDIDFKPDLGLKDKNFPEGRFTWYIGQNIRLRFAYTQIGYSGDKNIEREIKFGGETYVLGTRVITDLDVKYLRLGWIWQFINLGKGTVKFGTILDVKGFLIDASLKAPNMVPPVEESEKFAIGLPTIGVALDINPFKIINLFAEISGLHAGKYGYFLDGEAGLKIIPIKYFSIFGGYRIFNIKAEKDPDFAKLKISGPFVGATIRF